MKITKRIILIILSARLVLSAAACGKAEENPKGEENTPPVEQNPPQEENPPSQEKLPTEDEFTLSEELKKEIEDAMYATRYPEGSKLPTYIYYGTHSGYTVLYFPLPQDKSNSIYLDPIHKRYLIFKSSYFEMYAYKDGSFFPMWEICQQGVFTEEDMEKMYNYHYGYK